MINLKHPQILTFLLGALLFFSACKKDSGPNYQPPVTEPLTFTAVVVGDTVVIKGQNFSTTASENVITFNGVVATVVSATETEIKVVVPANATTGKVEITVHNNTAEVATLTILPVSIYVTKESMASGYVRQLVALSPEDGKETPVLTFEDTENFMYTTNYLPATNEVIGMDDDYLKLMKVNVVTKKRSSVTLSTNKDIEFKNLVTDNSGNLYAVKFDDTQSPTMVSLVKLDANTGAHTVIYSFSSNDDWSNIVYLPATNEIAGLTESSRKLLKVNLGTKASSSVQLTTSLNVDHYYFVVAKGELYGIKYDIGSNSTVASLVRINPANGSETVLNTLSDANAIYYNFTYVPKRNELVAIWNDVKLYRFNLNTNTSSLIQISTDINTYYSYVSSN